MTLRAKSKYSRGYSSQKSSAEYLRGLTAPWEHTVLRNCFLNKWGAAGGETFSCTIKIYILYWAVTLVVVKGAECTGDVMVALKQRIIWQLNCCLYPFPLWAHTHLWVKPSLSSYTLKMLHVLKHAADSSHVLSGERSLPTPWASQG